MMRLNVSLESTLGSVVFAHLPFLDTSCFFKMAQYPYTIFAWTEGVSGAAPLASFVVFTAINIPALVLFWRWYNCQ